jgi:hypothetical protein
MARRLWIVGRIGIVLEHLRDDATSDQRLQLLLNISVSGEIDGFSGSFRATCASSSLNVNRNWNFRSPLIVSAYSLWGT